VPYPVGSCGEAKYRTQVGCINVSVRAAAAAVSAVQLLDLSERLCPKGVCEEETARGEVIRPDGVHFSLEGANSLSRWVFEQIQR
ncbi:MAG TPA: hypothetical protein VK745_19880, partial [Polyangiaceae bacterium]|nr:hypothetical protein [Polyangiaceae bacterium]